MLKKRMFLFLAVFVIAAAFVFADPAADIAKAGDDAWNNLIAQLKKRFPLG